MTFASAVALLVGALFALPVFAHLLRRSKTQEVVFPPTKLVPTQSVTSAQRRRVEDKLLLFLRAAMILCLAILGATPFVRCSRLSVERPQGASVALALVLDTSQSMRARVTGQRTRFDVARAGAAELLDSLREGDAVAIVRAGAPATSVLGATTDLNLVKRTLFALSVTDAATDLASAVQLAEASLKELSHPEKRVVLLSDLASTSELDSAHVWFPLRALSELAPNCGIAAAEQAGNGVRVKLGCNTAVAAQGRRVELSGETDKSGKASETLSSARLRLQAGEQLITLETKGALRNLVVRIAPDPESAGQAPGKEGQDDRIPEDDQAPVATQAAGLRVLVYTNPAHRALATGGPTIAEQALQALDETLEVRPSANLPESAKDLEGYSLFVVDDPPGLTPEARSALIEWINRGGVVLGLLGPYAASAELAASIEPFARDGVYWEPNTRAHLVADSLAWLGEGAQSLESLEGGGRLRLDAADLPGTQILGKWSDGVPWVMRRTQGSGTILTAGLPAAVENTDFPLRAGFLALLSHAVEEARRDQGPGLTSVATPWTFHGPDFPTITPVPEPRERSKSGLATEKVSVSPEALTSKGSDKQFAPMYAGLYSLQYAKYQERRVVTLDLEELTTPAGKSRLPAAETTQTAHAGEVNTSSEWALLVLGLFSAELVIRTLRSGLLRRKSEATATDRASSASSLS